MAHKCHIPISAISITGIPICVISISSFHSDMWECKRDFLWKCYGRATRPAGPQNCARVRVWGSQVLSDSLTYAFWAWQICNFMWWNKWRWNSNHHIFACIFLITKTIYWSQWKLWPTITFFSLCNWRQAVHLLKKVSLTFHLISWLGSHDFEISLTILI